MNWYFADGDRQEGPITEAQLLALSGAGKVKDDTYVWREGMPDWRTFGELKAEGAFGESAGAESPAAAQPSGQDVCNECGRLFPESEMITYKGLKVCGNCKPAFFQKVQEGTTALTLNYAGFWIRVGAVILDFILLVFLHLLLMMISMPLVRDDETLWIVFEIIDWLIGLGYYVFFHGKFGATPGKMALGIKVVVTDGSSVSYLRAFGRFFAEWISAIPLGIGYLIAAFDKEKRTLHDFICNTRVIHTS